MAYKFSTVKRGSRGNDVITLQAIFRAYGQLGSNGKVIEVDGIAGDNTVYAINAVRKSAKAYGMKITGKDGEFDSSCWQAVLGG